MSENSNNAPERDNARERNTLPPMTFTVNAYAVVDKEVKLNSSGRISYVYLPKNWAGKRVRVCLMDDVDTTE